MSVAGVIGLFRANPQHSVGDDGRMALADHLRELRARLLRAVLVLLIGLILALFFYNQLFDLIYHPYQIAKDQLKGKVSTTATINGAGGPLLLQLKLCGVAAVVATSPYWLYQISAVIMPGLHPHERRWSRIFAGPAPQPAAPGADLRRGGRPAVPGRRRGRLLHPAQGPDGPHRLHRRQAAEPRGLRGVLQLLQPDAAGLRGRLRDPAVRRPAEP